MEEMRKAVQDMKLTPEQRLALDLAMKGVDLGEALKPLEDFWEKVKPLYEKNLQALKSKKSKKCMDCGVHIQHPAHKCPECRERSI